MEDLGGCDQISWARISWDRLGQLGLVEGVYVYMLTCAGKLNRNGMKCVA